MIPDAETNGFSIWLPDDWDVVDEDNIKEDLSKPMHELIDKWNKYSESEKTTNFNAFLVSLPTDNYIPDETPASYLVGPGHVINRGYLEWNIKEMLRLKRKQGMRVGSWI